MKIITFLLSLFVIVNSNNKINEECENTTYLPNNCISFTVGSGTGCSWMCSYCANTLGTNNYYFTDGVCTYQTGGCVGNPISGVKYTCCST
jgi:hypothetical protein